MSIANVFRAVIRLVSDARTSRRLSVSAPAALTLDADEHKVRHPARLLDLSNGGAGLSLTSPVSPGSRAFFEHSSSGTRKRCTVRSCTAAGEAFTVGIEFDTPLLDADLQYLASTLSDNQSRRAR